MKKSLVIAVVLVMVVLSAYSASALFIGLTDGYIRDASGVVSGASVVVTVSGCSGGGLNGCNGSAISDVNGYYIVNNLNLPKLGGVSVIATKSGGSGSNSGTADNTQVAHVNVTICTPPTSPSLTDVPDGDNSSVVFNWTSGTDPNALPTNDSFRLDGIGVPGATSPHLETGISFSSHSWDVRTCNSGCCSPWVADTFTLTCPAPSAPLITLIPNSHNTSATFIWTSGTDPHGMTPIHDEFTLDSVTTNPAFSPIPRSGLSFGTHNWAVRTCNALCCGSNSSSFTIGNSAPSVPTNTNFTAGNTTTALTWTSGVDPDGDATYDDVAYTNGTLIGSAVTSPANVPTELLIKWRVRTCDVLGACSAWVDVESVTCAGGATTCTPCSSNNGGGGGKGGCTGIGVVCKKVQLYCNGIAFSNDTLLRLDLSFKDKKNKIKIYGVNLSLEDLEYCPWCYSGVKDYDEVGVDCGGSCRSCFESEIPAKVANWWWLVALILAVLGSIGYWLHKKGVFKKIRYMLRYRDV